METKTIRNHSDGIHQRQLNGKMTLQEGCDFLYEPRTACPFRENALLFHRKHRSSEVVQVLLNTLKDGITLPVEIFPGAVADHAKVAALQFFIHTELMLQSVSDLTVIPSTLQQSFPLGAGVTP